jgi:hypothetical protein
VADASYARREAWGEADLLPKRRMPLPLDGELTDEEFVDENTEEAF